jgi:hypothetical protein
VELLSPPRPKPGFGLQNRLLYRSPPHLLCEVDPVEQIP